MFDCALVGRLFGKRIPFALLNSELHKRWQGFGPFRLFTVSGDCFVCMFDTVEGRDAVLMGGPWIIVGQVLGIDCWTPEFSPSSRSCVFTPIWVRLPSLPLYCWGSKTIARIASSLGEPIWVDAATDRLERGLFARVCIRIDLSKALKPGLWIDGPYGSFFQKIEYEGLSSFCFVCGCVGHKAHNCKLAAIGQGNPSMSQVSGNSAVGVTACNVKSSSLSNGEQFVVDEKMSKVVANKEGMLEGSPACNEKGFGPWMLVQRKSRRNQTSKKGAVLGQFKAEAPQENVLPIWRPKIGAAAASGVGVLQDGALPSEVGQPIFDITGFSAPAKDAKGRSLRTINAQRARASRTHKERMIGALGPVALEPRKRRKAQSLTDGGDGSPSLQQ